MVVVCGGGSGVCGSGVCGGGVWWWGGGGGGVEVTGTGTLL